MAPVGLVIGEFASWLLLSVKILNEYEGGHLPTRQASSEAEGTGAHPRGVAIDRMVR